MIRKFVLFLLAIGGLAIASATSADWPYQNANEVLDGSHLVKSVTQGGPILRSQEDIIRDQIRQIKSERKQLREAYKSWSKIVRENPNIDSNKRIDGSKADYRAKDREASRRLKSLRKQLSD